MRFSRFPFTKQGFKRLPLIKIEVLKASHSQDRDSRGSIHKKIGVWRDSHSQQCGSEGFPFTKQGFKGLPLHKIRTRGVSIHKKWGLEGFPFTKNGVLKASHSQNRDSRGSLS